MTERPEGGSAAVTHAERAEERRLSVQWNADIRKLVLLRESLPKCGGSKWDLRFYGLTFGNIGIGVIRQERLP